MNEKMNDALSQISEQHIAQAAAHRKKRRIWPPLAAAVIALAIALGLLIDPLFLSANAVSVAEYPEYQWVYRQDVPAARAQLQSFFAESIQRALSVSNGNYAYSPMNLYLTLCTAAELTNGDEQILSALNAESLAALRTQGNELWNACYLDKGNQTLLASSLWLAEGLSYEQSVMDTLAQNYYTSVYEAKLGTDGANKAIASWLDKQTGNLLQNATKDIQLDPETVAALYSTVYYQAKWDQAFSPSNNTSSVFHTPDGDSSCTFLNQDGMSGMYYYGEDFSAIALPLKDNSQMWLILPDKGKTPADLLESGLFLSYVIPGETQQELPSKYMLINLSLPKFDIQANGDLKEILQAMGITNLFDPAAASVTSSIRTNPPAYFTSVNQATRVCIDEEGVTAASYIEMPLAGAGMPPDDSIDFILDRPFLFVITNRYQLPLFAGIVEQP